MRRLGAVVLLLVFMEVLACNNRKGKNYNKTAANDNEIAFVQTAAASGMGEIKLSQIALKNSKNTEVIDMAKKIIADHTDANAQLQQIAAENKISLSDKPDTAYAKSVMSLETKTGEAFDKEYTQVMVNDHEKAIKLFKAAETNTTGKIQDFAKHNLLKLQAHFNEANSLCTGLK